MSRWPRSILSRRLCLVGLTFLLLVAPVAADEFRLLVIVDSGLSNHDGSKRAAPLTLEWMPSRVARVMTQGPQQGTPP